MKIFVQGEIGFDTSREVIAQIENAQQEEPIEVEICSEGGSVFDGVAIANALSRHQGTVTTHAVGLCASIATVILMSGGNIVVDDNAFLLVHKPWCVAQGNSNELKKQIDALEKCEIAMMGYYRKHSKVADEVLAKYIEDETWFLGSEFAEVFDCNVLPCDEVLDIAAKCNLKLYSKVDERIYKMSQKIVGEVSKPEKEETSLCDETTEEVVETTEVEDSEKSESEKSETESTEVEQSQSDETTEVEEEKKDECGEEKKDDVVCEADISETDANNEVVEPKNEIAVLVDKLDKCEQKRRDFQAKVDTMKNEIVKLQNDNKNLTDEIEKIKMDASTEKARLMSEKQELESRLARLADSVFKVPSAESVDDRTPREILASLPSKQRAAYYKAHKAEIDG